MNLFNRLTTTHWVVLAGCLVSIGAMGSSLGGWSEALRPAFVFGAIGVIGSNIAAALVKPKE